MPSGDFPSNNQTLLMKQYKQVVALKNLNQAADTITIHYENLDSKTRGLLKDTIAKTLHEYSLLDLSPITMKYINEKIKQNMTGYIDIDYAKIDDEQHMLAYKLKNNIQNVLTERKKDIYVSLTLNSNY